MATLISTTLCLPRLLAWQDRAETLWFLSLTLAWCFFVMWGFVFAWEPAHGRARPLAFVSDRGLWILTTGAGIALALILRGVVDPAFREVFPRDYPATFADWFNQSLFQLTLVQLFLCYAPLAFFARLCPNPNWVAGLVVGLNLFVLAVKLGTVRELPAPFIVVTLTLCRVIIALLSIHLYRRGGIWTVSLLAALLQCRHLPGLH